MKLKTLVFLTIFSTFANANIEKTKIIGQWACFAIYSNGQYNTLTQEQFKSNVNMFFTFDDSTIHFNSDTISKNANWYLNDKNTKLIISHLKLNSSSLKDDKLNYCYDMSKILIPIALDTCNNLILTLPNKDKIYLQKQS